MRVLPGSSAGGAMASTAKARACIGTGRGGVPPWRPADRRAQGRLAKYSS